MPPPEQVEHRLESAVSDLVNAADYSATTAWYELETEVKAAEVEGWMCEVVQEYATAILDTSEQV